MTRPPHPGLKIFSLLFGVFYMVAFYFDLALFRYYPEVGQFHFARTEGILPGPEPAHAIRAVFEEAYAARDDGEQRVILFGLSGHGHFDMSAYDAYLSGTLEDIEFSEDEMQEALGRLPEAPAIA